MGKIYHIKLGLIKDTSENRALFTKSKNKKKKNDTTSAEPIESNSGNTDGVKKRSNT